MQNEFYLPADSDLAIQSTDNKQGRSTEAVSQDFVKTTQDLLLKGQEDAYSTYTQLVESGLAREIARINLPLALYTEIYWQCDLHNLMHFLKLRLDGHAQKEIRDYGKVILEIARRVAPLTIASFENNIQQGVSFSGEELEALRDVLAGKENPLSGKKLERFTAKLEQGIQK
jgi:thymidylate synthase (FAD)